MNSWLILIHVSPVPELERSDSLFESITDLAMDLIDDEFQVEASALVVSNFDVISMDDLDNLDTFEG